MSSMAPLCAIDLSASHACVTASQAQHVFAQEEKLPLRLRHDQGGVLQETGIDSTTSTPISRRYNVGT